MQQDNNIENKLRQQEAMEQPDLSQMDTHWQQMQAVLQPGSIPIKKGWPKWMLNTLSIASVVVLIGAAMLYLSSKKNNNDGVFKQKEITPNENSNAAIVSATPVMQKDTLAKETAASVVLSVNPSLIYNDVDQGNGEAKEWTEEDSILANVKLNYKPCETCPGKEEAVLSNAERQLRLTNLFTQLEKQEQHFIIDNSRDTLLQFEEGTVLLIPANSFGGMSGVEITTKEFYKMSDIVLNQLNTASNKEQLETGGMLYLQAKYNGHQVNINKEKPLRLFMSDTSDKMKVMGLFNGLKNESGKQAANVIYQEERTKDEARNPNAILVDTAIRDNSAFINWVPQNQYFVRNQLVEQERVLNIVDEPYKMKENKKGLIGYFLYPGDMDADKEKLKKMIKEKYGYYKVKLRPDFRNNYYSETNKRYSLEYGRNIGDSMWMDKEVADRYKITGTASRQIIREQWMQWMGYRLFGNGSVNLLNRSSVSAADNSFTTTANNGVYNLASDKILKDVKEKYSVNISQLGWINCDRFYADSRKKINYKVNIDDSAMNYYTMLVFDKINSMMTGFINGNEVVFQNIPVGEPVKVISIGINKKGETVYSVTHTTTSEEELKGLQFQLTSAPDLKASLSKLDK